MTPPFGHFGGGKIDDAVNVVRCCSMTHLSSIALLVSLVFLGCGPAPGAPAPKPRVLRASFSVVNHYDFTGKSPGKALVQSNKLSVAGTVTQRVVVDTLADDLSFSPVDNESPAVDGTMAEVIRCHLEDPESNAITRMDVSADYAGKIGPRVSRSVKKSKIGPGDELSFGVEANPTGAVTGTFTDQNGVTQPFNSLSGCTLARFTKASSDGQAQFAESWLVFPSLGARPAEGIDARLYDAITSLPKAFHVGVTTSAGRDAWRYKGTKVISDKDTSTETSLWAEDLEIDWRLE